MEKPTPAAIAKSITTVDSLISLTNTQLEELMYISFVPEKKDARHCYRSDFTLKTQKEATALAKQHKKKTTTKSDFFVFNERTKDILPFKKNDYLIYEHGYFTYDGKSYLSYDDNGKEIGRFSFSSEKNA